VGALRGTLVYAIVGHGRNARVPTRGTPTSDRRTAQEVPARCRGILYGCPSGDACLPPNVGHGVTPGYPQGAPLHQTALLPPQRVIADIGPKLVQLAFVANDPLIEIALPQPSVE